MRRASELMQTPLVLETLSGNPVRSAIFGADISGTEHIDLARWADQVESELSMILACAMSQFGDEALRRKGMILRRFQVPFALHSPADPRRSSPEPD